MQVNHIAVKIINHLGDEVMKVFRAPERNDSKKSCRRKTT